MRVLTAGAAALAGVNALNGCDGRVLASFRRALYVTASTTTFALVEPKVPAGPLHAVLDRTPPRAPAGTPVALCDGTLLVGSTRIRMEGMRGWQGRLPPPGSLWGCEVPETMREAASRSALLAAPWRSRAEPAWKLIAAGDLTGAGSVLGGLGPGLTPAGDDALAGLLLVVGALGGSHAQHTSDAALGRVDTGTISMAFLRWAARGQALAPQHTVLQALAEEKPAAIAGPLTRIVRVGGSSGADLLLGMVRALDARAQFVGAGGSRPDGMPVRPGRIASRPAQAARLPARSVPAHPRPA